MLLRKDELQVYLCALTLKLKNEIKLKVKYKKYEIKKVKERDDD